MRMFTTLLATATVGLALAPAAFADSATGDLYLTRSACSGASDVLGLSYDLGAYSGSCGSVPGITPVTDTYGGDKLPLPVTLDTSRPVHIAIYISSFAGSTSIGDETVGVALTGTTTKNKDVDLGDAEVVKPAAAMLQGGKYVQEFNLDTSKLTATTLYKSFSLDLTVGGSVGGGFVGIGTSVVSVPVFDDAILVPPDEE
jgi:hypothetical protein